MHEATFIGSYKVETQKWSTYKTRMIIMPRQVLKKMDT